MDGGIPNVGELLRQFRERRRFTREGLALSAGLSPATIAKIEGGTDPRTGKDVRPTPDTLRKLADALGEGDDAEADHYYTQLMRAANYLDGVISDAPVVRPLSEPSKPPLNVITRGVRDNPEIPPHVQRAIIELLQLTDELNRRAGSDE